MNQEQFITRHQQQWQDLEKWLDNSSNKPFRRHTDEVLGNIDFPHRYRQLCHHLALARSRLYNQSLITRLNHLVLRTHQRLYSPRTRLREAIVFHAAFGFPVLVRRQWRLVGLAMLLFYGPLFGMYIVLQLHPEFVYTVMEASQVQSFEEMYAPHATGLNRGDEKQSDFLMFGYYIRNNTGIGFQTFAGGLLFGLGSIFFLAFNGIVIGAIAGHLTHIGYQQAFCVFVIGHSAMELNAIVLSGAAGLKLGGALILPGRLSRVQALRERGRSAVQLVYGASTMFLIAALIEAFWSPITNVSAELKFTVGGILWVMVIVYFGWAGRGHEV